MSQQKITYSTLPYFSVPYFTIPYRTVSNRTVPYRNAPFVGHSHKYWLYFSIHNTRRLEASSFTTTPLPAHKNENEYQVVFKKLCAAGFQKSSCSYFFYLWLWQNRATVTSSRNSAPPSHASLLRFHTHRFTFFLIVHLVFLTPILPISWIISFGRRNILFDTWYLLLKVHLTGKALPPPLPPPYTAPSPKTTWYLFVH